MTEKQEPRRADAPPVPRDFAHASHSELVPFKSGKINIYKSPILYMVVITGVVAILLFSYLNTLLAGGDNALPAFQAAVKVTIGYLLLMALLVIFLYSRTDKPFWTYLSNTVFVALLIATPLGAPYFFVFRQLLPGSESMMNKELVPHWVAMFFGAGLMEELMKVTLVLFGAWIVVKAVDWKPRLPPWLYDMLSVRSPLDGLLLGAFGGAGFIFVETGGQYVTNIFQQVSQDSGNAWAGLTAALFLMLPRTIGGLVGHMAWAGITGYFIGLMVIRPGNAWKVVGLAWLATAALHATWNSQAFFAAFGYLSAIASGVLFVACLLKARQLEVSSGRIVESYGSILVEPARAAPAAAYAAPAPAPLAAAPPAPSSTSASPALALRFPSMTVPVALGTPLDLGSVAGLPQAARGVFAEVTRHPTRSDVFGLRNNGTGTWTATLRDGTTQEIGTGRNIRLADGVKITFGPGVTCEVTLA